MKDIGDRMKMNYEKRGKVLLTRRTPVIIRVDGRAFHTLTKSFERPFDSKIMDAMYFVAKALMDDIQGARLAYVQSDEVSVFVCDWMNLQSEAWFDYNVSKLCSISASIATVAFNKYLQGVTNGDAPWAQFDSRCFNIPESELSNYFLWRAKDWYRNSVTMYAHANFSHRQLHRMSCSDMHEMLHELGKNWASDLTDRQKNATFIGREGFGRMFVDDTVKSSYEEINKLVQRCTPT